MDMKTIMQRAMDNMPDTPNMEPLKFFASGPASEAAARAVLGDMVEIVRTDLIADAS